MPDANAIIVPPPVIPDAPPAQAPAAPAQAPAAPAVPAAPAQAPAAPAQPPAAPAAAPAAGDPPVTLDTPAPAAAPTTPPQDAVVVYEKTGDSGLDVALKFVGERGFGPDHPAMKAAMTGDFSELEKALGALGDKAKGFEDYVGLAKDSFGRRQAATKAKADAVAKDVYDAAGGKEQWAAIQAWATQHADPDEKASLNAALKAGGLAAKATVRYLADLYKVHGKKAPAAVVKPDAASSAGGEPPLSAREYGAKVAELRAKLGTKMEASPEYAQLKARRQAARTSGR